jgi:uncharacterized membrane protein YhhN
MRPALYVVPFLVVDVFFLIRAELAQRRRQIYVLKPLATLLVVVTALLSLLGPTRSMTYSIGVLVGLLLSMGGDVALMFSDRKAFTVGLVLFLLAHVAYTVTFTLLNSFKGPDVFTALVLLIAGVGFYALIKRGLGAMKGPVLVYMLVISLMVNRALSTLWAPAFRNVQVWMIVSGAVLFYISDIMLALDRFWQPWKYTRLSLAFYYAGQVLIALSASYFS